MPRGPRWPAAARCSATWHPLAAHAPTPCRSSSSAAECDTTPDRAPQHAPVAAEAGIRANRGAALIYGRATRLPGGSRGRRRREELLINARPPAVRYAAADEHPFSCGRPERAVLARWHRWGFWSAHSLYGMEPGIPRWA